MRNPRTLALCGVAVTAAGLLAAADVVTAAVSEPASATAKIRNAMSAAPASVARAAAVADYPAKSGGAFPTLRAGTNGWICLPNDPATPGNDPICVDEQGMKWIRAWIDGKKPRLTSPGLSYMLRGGSDASNTDPAATKPAAGEAWMTTPPHVMVFPADRLDPATYTTDHHSGGPWVMWAGTAYEHHMIPVR